MLDKAGNSNTAERIALIERFLAWFKKGRFWVTRQRGPTLTNGGEDERLATEGLGCLGGAGKACEAKELEPMGVALAGQ